MTKRPVGPSIQARREQLDDLLDQATRLIRKCRTSHNLSQGGLEVSRARTLAAIRGERRDGVPQDLQDFAVEAMTPSLPLLESTLEGLQGEIQAVLEAPEEFGVVLIDRVDQGVGDEG